MGTGASLGMADSRYGDQAMASCFKSPHYPGPRRLDSAKTQRHGLPWALAACLACRDFRLEPLGLGDCLGLEAAIAQRLVQSLRRRWERFLPTSLPYVALLDYRHLGLVSVVAVLPRGIGLPAGEPLQSYVSSVSILRGGGLFVSYRLPPGLAVEAADILSRRGAKLLAVGESLPVYTCHPPPPEPSDLASTVDVLIYAVLEARPLAGLREVSSIGCAGESPIVGRKAVEARYQLLSSKLRLGRVWARPVAGPGEAGVLVAPGECWKLLYVEAAGGINSPQLFHSRDLSLAPVYGERRELENLRTRIERRCGYAKLLYVEKSRVYSLPLDYYNPDRAKWESEPTEWEWRRLLPKIPGPSKT